MPLLLVGVNHKTAPLSVREHFALSNDQAELLLGRLMEYMPHGVVLATCNRTEIYVTVHNAVVAAQHMQRFLADWTGISSEEITSYLYFHHQWTAVRHLFRVAAGLDSMILGEEQVLGQVRSAVELAQTKNAADPVLATAFRHAVRTGRRVRVETDISRHAVSISSVAVRLARDYFGGLEQLRVLIISAGEAGKLATRSLAGHGVRHLSVVSRSLPRAQALAEGIGGVALPFERMEEALEAADFVISATGAADHILTHDQMGPIMAQRSGRPILLVDIAVPRDVDPRVGHIPGVSLYNIDDVQGYAERNLTLRAQETDKAEAIVEAEVAKFQGWWRTQEVVPTITAIRGMAEAVRVEELHKTLQRLPDLAEADRARIEAMSKAIVSKLLHEPVMYLKERRNGDVSVETIRSLFGVDEKQPQASPPRS